MHARLSKLPGVKVFDANGRVIGRVKAALVDMETWLVDTLRIRVARRTAADLDLRWSLWRWPTIDVTTGLIHAAGDAIFLSVSIAELHDAPAPAIVDQIAAVH